MFKFKNYFSKVNNIDRENIVSIAVTPCTAKKMEIKREVILFE